MHEMSKDKLRRIATILQIKDIRTFIVDQYELGMSCTEIQEWFNGKCAPYVSISNRSIEKVVKSSGKVRTKKESFQNAIERGRMIYKTTEKPFKWKHVSLKQRYRIMQRDGFRCKCCGEREYLEIDHIIPIVEGGKNDDDNLQTLCRACNYGKYMNKNEV